MTEATHASSLLFCLFSFLFGVGMSGTHAVLYGVLAAARLLPLAPKRAPDTEASPSATDGTLPTLSEKARSFFLGYLVLDVATFFLFAVLYLLFLFLWNDGVFRLYSLLFAVFGSLLTHRKARFFIARPVAFLLSFPFRALRWLFASSFRQVLAISRRKKPKQLDETDKMV